MSSKVREFYDLASEMIAMMKKRKSLWLAPLMFAIILIGALVVVLEGSVVAPLIYTIF